MEISIAARLAIMFGLLILANKEYRKLDNIDDVSWSKILVTTGITACLTFVAGAMFYEAMLDILYLPMG